MYIEIYWVGDNRTVTASMSPHISNQLGTESMFLNTVVFIHCIVMIWVLVCNNMYQYECNFGSFYRNPTI